MQDNERSKITKDARGKKRQQISCFLLLASCLLLITGCYEEKSYVRYEKQLKKAEYDKGVEGYEKFIKAYPVSNLNAGAELGLIQGLLMKKKYKDALTKLTNFEENYSDFKYKDLTPYLKIVCYEKLNQIDSFMNACDLFVKNYPTSKLIKDVLKLKAAVLLKRKDYETLKKVVDELEIYSTGPIAKGLQAYYNGMIKLKDNPAEAVLELREAFNNLTKEYEEAEEALYTITSCYDVLKLEKDLLMTLEMYVVSYPEGKYYSEAIFKLAKILESKNRIEEAVKYYSDLVESKDMSYYQMTAIETLAKYYDKNNETEKAKYMYKELLKRYPDTDLKKEAEKYIADH
ncbi:MAG: tetratricopeptide repeat protein [Candidatus Hydrogenedentota bacterium]